MAIRIVLADDHPIVLQGLQRLFERHVDIQVVASCADGAAALEAVRAEGPDVLVLDLRMPGQSGLDVLRVMAAERLTCKSVILTAAVRDRDVAEAVKLGAMGLVLKESPPEALVDCVRSVYRGEPSFEKETAGAFDAILDRETASTAASEQLTPREIEIVRMVARGLRNRVIAEQLSISEGTVKVHLHNIYEKLKVDGRLELVLCAQEKGIV
jgi:DNA-binding NarL/FixJ family response regulator